MLPANQAVRLGLRAASRNPELAFGKALLDQTGNLLALLPLLLGGVLLIAVSGGDPLRGLLALFRVGPRLALCLAGAGAAVLALSFVASALFWAGALPLLEQGLAGRLQTDPKLRA